MENVSDKTFDKVMRWVNARKACESARMRAQSAETDLANATNDLGKFLAPADAKVMEDFHIWCGSGILRVTRMDAMTADYRVDWRKKPDDKRAMELGIE